MKYLGVVTNNNLPELIFTPMTPNEESSHSLFCQLSAIQVNQLIVALENTAFKVNVWNEQFRFTANSHQAQHLRDKHLLASLHQNYTESIRATFFVYSDGIVDLILTASRSHFSRQTLEQIAADCVLQATESPQASHSDRVKTEIDTTFATTDTIVHQIEGEPCDQRLQWLTALSLLLSRFTDIDHRVAVHTDTNVEQSDTILSVDQFLNTSQDTKSFSAIDVGVFFSSAGQETTHHTDVKQYRAFASRPYPMTFEFESHCNQIALLKLHVDSRRFSQEWAAHLVECLVHVASQLRSGVQNSVHLEWVPSHELTKLLSAGNSGSLPSFQPQRIDAIVANHAKCHPESIALCFENQSITYQELDEKATAIARNLVKRDVEVEDRIGVCMERSPELVIVMLGVLKAGGTYVPIDPSSPENRILYIVKDAQLKFMIAEDQHCVHDLHDYVISLKELYTISTDKTAETPFCQLGCPEHAAYIIYTSGSTGYPKGVVIPHTNVHSLIQATTAEFEICSDDVWTFFHSAAFDFSVWEIWGCLLTGGRLVIVTYWGARAPNELFQLLLKERVTVLSQTPTALYQFIEQALSESEQLDALRLITLGGEALDSFALLPWFNRYPESSCRVVNMFGITETTVHVTAKTMLRQDALIHSRSVGKALAGWYLYVMDENKRPLPFGALGEIYVGGAGVASQYLNRPELTNERFLDDFYTQGKMYRSGDKGALLNSGDLLYEGRLDNQVKLRGFRIELGEIRQTLLRFEGVKSVAVILNNSDCKNATSAKLDCYLVLHNTSPEDVKNQAAQVLPEYMLPSTYTTLATLPMTTNGKLDVKALPAPKLKAVHVTEVKAGLDSQPHDQGETNLIDQFQIIWADVFGMEIGVADNFFDLGGNSLLAVRMITKAHQLSIMSLSIRDIYVHQSIGKIVSSLEEN